MQSEVRDRMNAESERTAKGQSEKSSLRSPRLCIVKDLQGGADGGDGACLALELDRVANF